MKHNGQNTTEWNANSPEGGMGQQQLRVLLVGSEASLRDQWGEYLRRADGYEVDTAASSQAALSQLEQTQAGYEVVVIDDWLASGPDQEPGSQGVKFIGEVKARYPDLDLVLLIDQDGLTGLEALQAGAHRYLAKPVNLEELELVLQMTAEHSRLKTVTRQRTPIASEDGPLLEKVTTQGGPSEWMAAQLLVLHEITKEMQSELGQPGLLNFISQLAAKLLGGDAAGILLLDDKKQHLTFKGAYGLSQKIVRDTRDLVGRSIAGRVVELGEPIVANDIPNDPRFHNPAADEDGLLAIVSTPLQVRDEIIGTLDVHSRRKQRAFDEEDLRFLSLMSTQAAVAIQNAELAAREADKLRRLARLAQASGEIMGNLGAMSLDQRLNLIAKYAVEILEAEACGISLVKRPGFLSLEASYGHREGQFEKGKELAIRSGSQTGLSGHIAYEGKLFNAHGDGLTNHFAVRGEAIHTASGYCYSLLAIPLKKKNEHEEELVGLLRMDNKRDANGRTGPTVGFTQEDEWILSLFADAVIVAIEGAELVGQLSEQKDRLAQLVERAGRHKRLLETLYEASNAIVSSQDSEQAQQTIVERARLAVKATRVILVLIDEMAQVRKIITAGDEMPVNITDVIRPEGLSMQVMRTGQLFVIEDANVQRDRVNPSKIWRDMVAGLCLPVSLEEKQIGVMWVHYDRPHHFVGTEIEALQLYVNQSAIVYDSARRIKELEYMRRAAEALAGVAEPLEVLKQIVESASEVLQADSVSTSYYDVIRGKFAQDSSVTAGIPSGVWGQFCQNGSWLSQTDGQVMEQGWIGVEDVSDQQQYPFLERWYQEFLEQAGIQSFQGVALTVEEETLGVLYVNYRLPRSFSEEEQKTARTFANHAALALKKAKLLEQVSKARNTAKVVAEVTTLENIDDTLELIAEGTQDALNCDVVTLYGYDQDKDRLNYPPTMVGVRYPERASRRSEFAPNYIVFEILKQGRLYIIEDVSTNPFFKDRRFTQDEQISSCVAIPLKVGPQKVGVMFVNYRSPHRFTWDELINIQLFANQAAVAIRNVQLYERVQKRAAALQAIYEAGQVVTASLDLDQILSSIVEQAWQLISIYGDKKARFSHLALVEDNLLKFVAVYPPERLSVLKENVGDIDLSDSGLIGVTGRAVKSGQSQLIGDVTRHPDYLEGDPESLSELAVPIKVGEGVIGVINVEHSDSNAFDEDDQHALEALAAQAAIAIQNANLYQERQHRARQMAAIAEISRTINTSLDLYIALNTILTSIKSLIDYVAAEICLWHEEDQAMVVVGQAGDVRYTEQAQGIYVLDEGYEGWIARHWKPLLIEDSFARQDIQPKVVDPDKPIRSFLGVPLQAGSNRLGALQLISDAPRAFDNDDEELLGVIGQHAIIAIKNARLFEAEQRRAEYLAAIHQVSVATSSTLDSSEIFRRALVAMLDVIKLDQGSVTLFDYEGGYGYTVVEDIRHSQSTEQSTPIPLEGNATIEWILAHKQPLVIENIPHDARLDGIRELVDYGRGKSLLLAPLVIKGKVIGTINLYTLHTPRRFTDREIELAQTMSNQVATAIENAQLYEQAERRVSVLNTLYEAGRAVTSSLKLDDILDLIAEQAWRLTIYQGKKISFASIRLVEVMKLKLVAAYPQQELLDAGVTWGKEIDLRSEGNTPLGIMGWVVQTGKPQLVGDVTADPNYLETHPQTRSELAVPIKIGDEMIGVINVEHPDYNAFSQDDQHALESLAAQAAVAIQNARLFRETQRQVRLLDAASKVARGATGILDEDQLLDQAVQLIINSFDFFYHAAVFLLDDNQEYAILRAASSGGGQRMLERGHRLKVGQEGIVGFVTQHGEPRLTPDVKQDPHHYVNPDLSETRAEVAFPLIARGQVIGALDVQSTEVVNLRGEDVATLQTMADQLANAIHNARLFEAEQRRVEHLSTVYRVSVAANSTMKMEKILHRTVAEMVWAFLGIDQGDVLLFDLQDNRGRIVAEYPRSGEGSTSVPLAETSIKWILTHKRPLVIENVFQDSRLDDTHWGLKRWGVRSMLLTPLLVSGEVMGTINLYALHTQRQFTADEVEFAQTMANQVATVIRNLQTREEVSATQTVNSAFMLLSRWAHKVRQKSFALRKDLDSLKKDLPLGLFDDTLERMSESIQALSLPARELVDGVEESPEQEVNLARLLSDTATRLCRNRKVSIELGLNLDDARRYAVKGNRLFLEIAIEMLIENAVESIEQKKEPGMLDVQCRLLDDTMSTQIRDTGCGIPSEFGQDLFHGRVASKKGFGYGSFTAANILRAHKGDVRVVETGDEGTLIEFYLPATKSPTTNN